MLFEIPCELIEMSCAPDFWASKSIEMSGKFKNSYKNF